MPVRFDKRVLVNILRILLIAEHVQRQPQHAPVVPPYQRIKRGPLALLGSTNQFIVLGAL